MIPIKDNIPTDRFPFVTVGLIVANFVVYLLAIQHGGSFISGPDLHEVVKYGAIPDVLTHPGLHCTLISRTELGCAHRSLPNTIPTWETVFTGMFMHASIIHIGGNMLFLWIFGNNVEDSMGRVKFLIFYLLGGLIAFAVQTLASLPGGNDQLAVPTLGASGAISAVLGGYVLLYPRARVVTVIFIIFFFTILELPALLVLGFWFLEQAYSVAISYPNGGGGGVAYGAHVGGFLFGLLTIRLWSSRRRVAQQQSGAHWRR